MAETNARLGKAAQALGTDWSAPKLDALYLGTRRRARRRQQLRGAAVAAVLLAAGGLVAVRLRPAGEGGAEVAMTRVEVASDGDVAVLHGGEQVRTLAVSGEETRISLLLGQAHFDVKPQRGRVVHVEAGRVVIDVVGTAFVVERRPGEVRVEMEVGTVRVHDRSGTRVLKAGEVGLFEDAPEEAALAPAPAAEEARAPLAAAPEPAPEVAPVAAPPKVLRPASKRAPRAETAPAWRELAQAGAFDEAWAALKTSAPPRDEPEDLLRAADVARLSGHPREALAPLQRVVAGFAADSRAPLAAFTLGRLWLEELGSPRQAAEAFARAQALAPGGPLQADALAREVESLSRAGDGAAAKARAADYLAKYPRGARAGDVKRWGALP